MARVRTGDATKTGVQNSTYTYAVDAEASDAYAIAIDPAVTAYKEGQHFSFKANTANTGASSLNVNGLGAKTLKKNTDQDTETGDIESGSIVEVRYDGTSFQIVSTTATAPITAESDPVVGAVTGIVKADGGGNISAAVADTDYQSVPVEGAFVDGDKTKLDGIEALADVTDTANVTSAGALMDSEVDADIKTLALPASTTISAFGKTLVDDAAASNARTTLDVDQAGTDNSTDVTLAGTPNYITIAGQVITRALINLTSHITGILPIANGGTNSSTENGARTNLGVAIGSDVQAFDANNATASSTTTFTNKTFDANGTGNSLSNVDVADLSNGTDGELITWDAAGAPATVAVGTATHVLTSNGVGTAPTFQEAGGGGGNKKIFLSPGASAFNGTGVTLGTFNEFPSIAMTDGNDNQAVNTSFTVPSDFTSMTSMTAVWATSATSGNLYASFSCRAVGSGESMSGGSADTTGDTAWATGGTVNGSDHTDVSAAIDGVTFTVGDTVGCRIEREGAQVEDTLGATAHFLGFILVYA